jgi:RHS repeat-associated protein
MRDYCARVVFILFMTMVSATSGHAASALDLVPSRAPVGAYLVIVGSGLDAPDVSVTFTGPGGNRVSATPIARTPSLLDLRVPLNATSGDVRVVQGNTSLGVLPFTVTSTPQIAKAMTLVAASTSHDLLKKPSGLFVAGRPGTTYVADTAHHQIRIVGASGDVRVLAGSGTPGFVNGPAASAEFHAPEAVAVDEVRNIVYVADTGNHAIRMLTGSGTVQTFAGSGRASDRDGSASEAGFNSPAGLALDALGNLYVADSGNDRIRKVTPAGMVTTVASGLKRPRGVAVAENGVVYVADTGNHVIRKIENGITSFVAGTGHPGQIDGAAALAEFKEPASLAIDESGALLVADTQNHAVRRIVISGNGGTVSTIAGTAQPGFRDGDPLAAQFNQPSGIAERGAVFVVDSQNDALRMLVPELTLSAIYPRSGAPSGGTLVRIFGSGFIAGQTSVAFGSTAANDVTYVSSTELLVNAPAGVPGVVDVLVSTSGGTRTLADPFRYVAPPTITAVAPIKGAIAGGQTVTISGTNFIAGETSVSFGGDAATTAIVTSSTTLTAVNPAHAAGTVGVSVTTPGGTAVLDGGFRYLDPPAIASFTPLQGRVGDAITISGSFDSDLSGNTVSLGNSIVPVVSVSGTTLVVTVPAGSTTGRLTVTSAGGTATTSVDFVVLTYTTITIAPATASLQVGDKLQLAASGVLPNGTIEPLVSEVTWTSGDATIASVDGNGVAHALADGSAIITASYHGLSASSSVTVRSGPPLPPDPSTLATPPDPTVVSSLLDEIRFLYTGPNAIQAGVMPETIQERRAAVFRGRVLKLNGNPQPGVTVSVLNHHEYGQTVSRADGFYDLVVNGGGPLTLRYERSGAIPAQRTVVSKWTQQVGVDDVVLIEYDATATSIATASGSVQVARGAVSTNVDGSRRATLLFPANTSASLVLSDGTLQSVPTLTIRATEFTVGANGRLAMPAGLPATTAYTYCVELSADEATAAGATEVRFSRPAVFYVENFIGFPVGGAVPVGYYDRTKGAWVSSDNGRVIKILAVTGGLAQIDGDGNGSADTASQLSALGIDSAEQQTLATLYAPGQTLWRTLISHLTPYDMNWPFVLPSDARRPSMSEPEFVRDVPNGCKVPANSTVDCHNQTLAEEIPVAGTSFSLLYDSGRVGAGQYKVNVPLTGASIPASLRRVEVTIAIAGRTFRSAYSPRANLIHSFVWDGKDAYGRVLNGKRPATISLGYVYAGVYASVEQFQQFQRAWANASGVPLSISSERPEITMEQSWEVPLGALHVGETGFAGWMLSPHRLYDGRGRVLMDGATTRSSDANNDGRVALRTVANLFAFSIAVASDGSVFVADDTNVKKVDTVTGLTSIVAGRDLFRGFTADGATAAGSAMKPHDVAIGPDDSLYIDEPENFRVRRVINGKLVTVAGNGVNGFNSTVPVDGRLATSVPIANQRIFVGQDGTLYIAERQRVTAVGPDGIMRTIAGTSAFFRNSDSGDGGPARNAGVSARAVTVGSDGSVYILNNLTVRKITPDGIINRIAGPASGNFAIAQDGQAATSGRLGDFLTGIAVTADDTLLLMEGNQFDSYGRVRAVSSQGVLSTFAGNRVPNAVPSPDGSLARASAIPDSTYDVNVGPDGSVFMSLVFGLPGQEIRIFKTDPVLPAGAQIMLPSEDGTLAYVFEQGRHVRTVETLFGSSIHSFSYDQHGYLDAVTDADGNITRIERDINGLPTAIVAPGGQRTLLVVSAGALVRVTNPASESNEFSYDGPLMVSRRDPRGNFYTYTYNAAGRLVRDADPAGGFISLVRSGGRNFTVTRTSAEGRTHRYDVTLRPDLIEERLSIDSAGNQTQSLLGDGSTIVSSPDGTSMIAGETGDPRFGAQTPLGSIVVRTPSGRVKTVSLTRSVTLAQPNNPLSLTSSTDVATVNGRRFTTSFNASTRRQVTSSPLGRTAAATFDARGRVVSAEVTGLTSTSIQYLANGLVETVTSGTRQARFSYNDRRELTAVRDSLLRTVGFAYDAAGRVTRKTLPDGRVIAFEYDGNGNPTSITPPGRSPHRFAYTLVNQHETYSPPAVDAADPVTRYLYNKDRQIVSIVLPDGRVVNVGYDPAGRTSAVVAPQGTYRLTYNGSTGMLSSLQGPNQSRLEYEYDGSLLTATKWSGEVSGSVTFSYDNDFRVISEDGTSLGYDNDSLLTSAGALSLTRSAQNGLLTGTTLLNITDAFTYNEYGEITGYSASYNGSALLALTFTRDAAGRVAADTQQLAGSSVARGYDYDLAGRLIRVRQGGIAVAEYDYDSNGNRIAHRYLGGSSAASYDAQDRLVTYDDATYTYTANGDLKTSTAAGITTTYDYDVFGNLRSVNTGGVQLIEYVIDARNRRVGKKVNGILVQGWLYADQLRIVAELDGSGAVVSRFVYGSKSNAPDYMTKGDTIYRLISDLRGSIRLVLDASNGSVAQRIDYDKFGRILLDSNPGFQPFGFAGGLYDRDTGLVRFGARDHDGRIGRWVNRDPIGFRGGEPNLYSYVGNDPINYIDPSGLSGMLTIYSSDNSGSSAAFWDGHSWIVFVPDGGNPHSYGTYGPMVSAPRGLNKDWELDHWSTYGNRASDEYDLVSRTRWIDDAHEKALMDLIDFYRRRGQAAWSSDHPCTGFARTAWQTATGEGLSDRAPGDSYHTPSALNDSIMRLNGGLGARVILRR